MSLRALVAALLAIAMLSWPALASAQGILRPRGDRDQAFGVAPGGTEAAVPQLGPLLDLTAAVNRLIRRFDHGDFKQVAADAADALQELRRSGNSGAEPVMFRVGMFVEDVTLNMLRLFSEYRGGTPCKTLVQDLENELKVLEGRGGGNGAVFGRGAVAAVKKRCSV
jgi:hypothetical protein